MNIKATLARLDNSLAQSQSVQDLLLLSGPSPNMQPTRISAQVPDFIHDGTSLDHSHSDPIKTDFIKTDHNSDTINIVVGYSGSHNSQVALDLTLLIAYQTRLATRKTVVVQTVYVLEGIYPTQNQVQLSGVSSAASHAHRSVESSLTATATVPERRLRRHTVNCKDVRAAQIQHFEAADRVLWQARTFATEWRGSLSTHLRFGSVATELCKVAQQEQAHLLVLGCHSVEHPLVQQLQDCYSCPVLGIPREPLQHQLQHH